MLRDSFILHSDLGVVAGCEEFTAFIPYSFPATCNACESVPVSDHDGIF
jgi:hypothetical protein